MFKNILIVTSMLALGSCAYAKRGAVQDVEFETPGAHGAKCYVYVDDVKHIVYPPQILSLSKDDDDMKVDCLAPGNRRQVIYIDPFIEEVVYQNSLNAGIGAPWDNLSNAMYKWPDTVKISFVDTPTLEEDLPAHNNPDIRQPETYKLEEFLPGRMRLNSDAGAVSTPLVRRGEAWYQESDGGDDNSSAFREPAQMSGGKGDLQQVIDGLDSSPSSAESAPVPLYPGQ